MFDRVYVVHLPNPQRRAAMDAELARLGWQATFLHAKPPTVEFHNGRRNPRAEMGCSLSHVKAIVRSIADGARRPLFLEDDVVFKPDTLSRLAKVAQELPDWDVLYLGGHPRSGVTRHSANLVRVGGWSFAEAYALNGSARPFLDYWLDRVGQPQAMFDIVLGEFAAKGRGYCVHPLLTEQPPNWSQIGQKHDSKGHLLAKAWAQHLP